MLTVVDLVVNSDVVESGEEGWLNTAGRWDSLELSEWVTSQLQGSHLEWVAQHSGWEDAGADKAKEAHFLQDSLAEWGPDLSKGDELRGTVSTGNNVQSVWGALNFLLRNNVSNGEGPGNGLDIGGKWRVEGQKASLWSLEGDVNLVKGDSLGTDNITDRGKHLLVTLLGLAHPVLWGLADLLLQLLRLLKLGNNHKRLLDHLLNVPPVHDLSSDSSLAFHAEAVGLTHDWSNLNSSHSKTRGLGTNGSNKVDLLQLGARRAQKHTGDLNNVSLLKLGQDSLDLVVLGWNVLLSDL